MNEWVSNMIQNRSFQLSYLCVYCIICTITWFSACINMCLIHLFQVLFGWKIDFIPDFDNSMLIVCGLWLLDLIMVECLILTVCYLIEDEIHFSLSQFKQFITSRFFIKKTLFSTIRKQSEVVSILLANHFFNDIWIRFLSTFSIILASFITDAVMAYYILHRYISFIPQDVQEVHIETTFFMSTPTNTYQSITDSCSICLNELDKYVTLKCKHNFHRTCILEWYKYKLNCPLCRL